MSSELVFHLYLWFHKHMDLVLSSCGLLGLSQYHTVCLTRDLQCVLNCQGRQFLTFLFSLLKLINWAFILPHKILDESIKCLNHPSL